MTVDTLTASVMLRNSAANVIDSSLLTVSAFFYIPAIPDPNGGFEFAGPNVGPPFDRLAALFGYGGGGFMRLEWQDTGVGAADTFTVASTPYAPATGFVNFLYSIDLVTQIGNGALCFTALGEAGDILLGNGVFVNNGNPPILRWATNDKPPYFIDFNDFGGIGSIDYITILLSQTFDFSIAANRRLFNDANCCPVDTLPLSPNFFFHGNSTTFPVNRVDAAPWTVSGLADAVDVCTGMVAGYRAIAPRPATIPIGGNLKNSLPCERQIRLGM